MQSQLNQAQKKKSSGGFVFYPQQYILNPSNPDESFALGVTHGGFYCRVYINPTESARSKARNSDLANDIPAFEAFAETHKRARKPCFCSPDNSSQKPNGILLIEQAEKIQSLDNIPTFQCKWASVLRDDSQSPSTFVGRGYLEISYNVNQKGDALAYTHQYRDLSDRVSKGLVTDHLEAKIELERLYSAIVSERKKVYVGCIIKHDEITTVHSVNPNDLKNALRPQLLRYTSNGMYGGALIRVRLGNNIYLNSCSHCDMTLDYKSNQVADVEVVLADFIKYNFGKIKADMAKDQACVIEVIPVHRVNCGPKGNSKYGKEMEQSSEAKVLKAYVDKQARSNPLISFKREKKFLFANIAIKTAAVYSGQSSGNILLSVIHAFSAPKGNIFTIDEKGEASLRFIINTADNGKSNPAQVPQGQNVPQQGHYAPQGQNVPQQGHYAPQGQNMPQQGRYTYPA
jgi:hypothetical protein